MGQKVHPIGFRLGLVHDWQAKWYAEKQFSQLLQEDLKLREAVKGRYADAGISRIDIERQANQLLLTVHTARPGIVIGRGGQRVEETRQHLESLSGKKVRLNIQEIRQPELDGQLVAQSIAEQMERRVSYRRAIKQTSNRTMQAGAKGIKIICSGRLGGAEIARQESLLVGRVPLHTLRANIDYGFAEARTTLGRVGVKVWIYKGDVLARGWEQEAPAAEETAAPKEAEIIKASSAAEAAAESAAPAAPDVASAGPEAETVAEAKMKQSPGETDHAAT